METSKPSPSTSGPNAVRMVYEQKFNNWAEWVKLHTEFINRFNDLTGCENEDPLGSFNIMLRADGAVFLFMEMRNKNPNSTS